MENDRYADDIYSLLIKKIKDETDKISEKNNNIILYHGSKIGISEKIQPLSRSRCDFGKGFYMGTDPSQPLTLVCDFEKSKFYILSLNISGLKILNIPVGIDWAMLVAYNRGKMEKIKGTELYEKYRKMCEDKDIIIGNIANDRMFYVIDNFFAGNITDMALVSSLSALKLGKQYVAVSQKACDMIRIEKEIILTDSERTALQKLSQINRKSGIDMADKICKAHRREGLFFDEIIENAKER